MIVEIVEGDGTFKTRRARIRCETCQKEREVQYKTAYTKQEHPCTSCLTRKSQTGRTHSKETCLKRSQILRKKGWRLHCGYKEVMVDTDHPRKRLVKKGKHVRVYPYVFEHQLVIEQAVGRFLESHEIVHHLDGDKLNNDLSNLFLCTGPDATSCRSVHMAAHQSLESVAFQLYKAGIIEFADGAYRLSAKGQSLLESGASVS